MIRIKKLLLSFVSLSVSITPFFNLTSCSKIHQKSSDEILKFNWDEGKTLSRGKKANINITNFADLKKQGLVDNMAINIEGNSVSLSKFDKSKNSSSSFFLEGNNEGESTVTVTYTSILHLKVSTGKFKIRVVDYSKIKVQYNEKEGTNKNPFTSNNGEDLNIGSFDPKDWSSFSPEFKSSLKVQTQSNINDSDNVNNDPIHELYSFKINDDGKIIASLNATQKEWKKLNTFDVKIVDSLGTTNFKDNGHKFWLGKLNPQQSLKIIKPEITNIKYSGSKDDYEKVKSADVLFKVNNDSFKWELATFEELNKIKNNLSIVSTNQEDSNVIVSSILVADKNAKQFKLTINYKEISFSNFTLKLDFKFFKDETTWSDSVEFELSNHRHGVDETESDIKTRELTINYKNGNSYDFINDSGINSQQLINPFEIWPPVEDSLSSLFKANGYSYSDVVLLSKNSFDKIKNLKFDKTEDKKQIQSINNTIKQITASTNEKNIQDTTGVTLNADFTENKLVLQCNGIKLDKNNSFSAGEYFIVIKYKDNKNNYQFSYVDFKWNSGTIEFNNNPINIESHLYSMPIENNPNNKENFNDIRAIGSAVTGKDTAAGSIDNPLLLTEEDSEIKTPDSKRIFSRTQAPKDGYYRGYLKVNNIKDYNDLKNTKVSIENADSIAKLESKPIIKGEDGNYYIDMTLLGQKDKNTKAGNFTIKLVASDNTEYKFTVYYSAYLGSSNEDFAAEGFIDSKTSLYVSQSASDSALYLGISNKSEGSIKDVYFDDGYSYLGNKGVVTTDVSPDVGEPDSLKNIENITFAGDISSISSYIFMASPNSGVTGYITFYGKVGFVSTNSYVSASNKSDDPSFKNSAVLLGGNLRNKASSPIIGEKGINFMGLVTVAVNNSEGKISGDISLSIIATTKTMICGDVIFNSGVGFITATMNLKSVSLITNEVIPADNNVLPKQLFGDITVKIGFEIDADASPTIGERFNTILADKNATNLRSLKDNDKLSTINIDIDKDGGDGLIIYPSYYETINSKKVGHSFLIATDITDLGSNTSNKSTLPNINVNDYMENFDRINHDRDNIEDLELNALLARGYYSDEQRAVLNYIKNNQETIKLELKSSTLKSFYNNYFIL